MPMQTNGGIVPNNVTKSAVIAQSVEAGFYSSLNLGTAFFDS